jgi:hypothetical protein
VTEPLASDGDGCDLYTGFYIGDLALKNEILFRMGKSKDPNWIDMGGQSTDIDASEAATNKLDSIGFAGGIDWTVSHSGANLGPTEYNKGDASRQTCMEFFGDKPCSPPSVKYVCNFAREEIDDAILSA